MVLKSPNEVDHYVAAPPNIAILDPICSFFDVHTEEPLPQPLPSRPAPPPPPKPTVPRPASGPQQGLPQHGGTVPQAILPNLARPLVDVGPAARPGPPAAPQANPRNGLLPMACTEAGDARNRVRDQRLHPREKYHITVRGGVLYRPKWTKQMRPDGRASRDQDGNMIYTDNRGEEKLDTTKIWSHFAAKKGRRLAKPQDSPADTSFHRDLVHDAKGRGLHFAEPSLIWVCAFTTPLAAAPTFYSHVCKAGRVHHTTFTGSGVVCAGEWVVKDGELAAVNGISGHYRPKLEALLEGLAAMSAQGMLRENTKVRLWDKESNRPAELVAKGVLALNRGDLLKRYSTYGE